MPQLGITVTVITLNEEKNLERALKSAAWADEIIVVDSGSNDRTLEIAKTHGAKVFNRAWQGYGQQKNFAQAQASHDWILNIDADEVIPAELKSEIQAQLKEMETGKASYQGFRIPRKTFYLGRWILHGGWYPNYLCRLAHRHHARWSEPEVHEELEVQGPVFDLNSPLEHYSFHSIQDQVHTNVKYSWLGFQRLKRSGKKPSLTMLVIKPLGKFIETYFFKGGILDGLPGYIISINAAHSAFLKYAYHFEEKCSEKAQCRS